MSENKHSAACIFDLDGTLLDTIGDLADAANHVLQQQGFPVHSETDYMRMIGDGIRELVARMLPEDRRDADSITLMVELLESRYQQCWNIRTRIYPGIVEMLEELSRCGATMAILSNKPHPFTVTMVEKFLGRWHFDPVWGAGFRFPRKPDPAAAFAIARHWNLDIASCIMVGDSEADVRTAKAAGMVSVAVGWGFRSRNSLPGRRRITSSDRRRKFSG